MRTTDEERWKPEVTLASELRALRWEVARREGLKKALTVEEMARRCSVPKSTWYSWEKGVHPQGEVAKLRQVEDALRLEEGHLVNIRWYGDRLELAYSDDQLALPIGYGRRATDVPHLALV